MSALGRLHPSAPVRRPSRPNRPPRNEAPPAAPSTTTVSSVGVRAADHLDLVLVLVGPDVRHRRETVRGPLAREEALCGVLALLGRVRAVLDPQRLPGHRMRPPGEIAGRDHAGSGGERRVAARARPGPTSSPDPSSHEVAGSDAHRHQQRIRLDASSRRSAGT